jgi:hypothetical protein
VLALIAIARPAQSQWQPNGVLLSGNNPGDVNLTVPDGTGGVFVAWRAGPTSGDVLLQRVLGSGLLAPGWPASGLPLADTPEVEQLMRLAPDGRGGAFVMWYRFFQPSEFEIYVDNIIQRIGPDGVPAPGWPAAGVRIVAPGRQDPGDMVADGTGGVFVVWTDTREYSTNFRDVYAQHLLDDGASDPAWPAGGLPLAVGAFWSEVPRAISDGASGVFFVWGDTRQTGFLGVFGTRLHSDGSPVPNWNATGNFLSTLGFRDACSDGAGGIYVLTTDVDLYYYSDTAVYLHRFGPTGSPAPGWTMEGVVLCDVPGFRSGQRLTPDGQGGAIATWYDGEIHAIRILPNGSIAPGWAEDGTRVSDPAAQRYNGPSEVVHDGLGGAFVSWDANGLAMVQHLTAAGQPAPGWPVGGLRVATTIRQDAPHIATDGAGGAIVAWNEGCPYFDCSRAGIWAQRFVASGIVATQLSLVSASIEADRVKLDWAGAAAAGLTASVYRRGDTSPWAPLARISADGTGHLRFDDRDVRPGERYAYRLGYYEDGAEQFTGETWIEVPAGFELALAGFRPNPASGSPLVSFTLPRAGPGRLELFDLAGRRVADRDLAGLPAGRHTLRLGAGADLPPAAYLIRLTHAASTRSARGVVVR